MIEVDFIEACKKVHGEVVDYRDGISNSIVCAFDNGQIEFEVKNNTIRTYFTKGEYEYRAGKHISAGWMDRPEEISVQKEKENSVYPGIYFKNKEGYLKVNAVDEKLIEVNDMKDKTTIRCGGWIKQGYVDIADMMFNVG